MVTAAETRFGEVLALAREEGRAVGAFTCYDLLGFELGRKVAALDLKGLGDGVVEEVVEAKLSAFGWIEKEA